MARSSPRVDSAPTFFRPPEPVRILVGLYNSCISQALCTFLRQEEPSFQVRHREEAEPGFAPTHFLTDLPTLEEQGSDFCPDAKIIIFDEGLDRPQIEKALRIPGFAGLIRYNCDNHLLIKAIRCVQNDEIWIDSETVKSLLQHQDNRVPEKQRVHLTLKEEQIVEMILQGLKNKEIAARIFLSESTVKVYISRIYRKYQVAGRPQLIRLLTQSPPLP